jgi:autotransporter-associated beta strand protein
MSKQLTRSNRSVQLRHVKARFTTGFLPAFVLMFSVQTSQAGSATWNLNPPSNDWETAANWTPATVPDGPSDIATFDVSNVTAISLNYVDLSEVVFNPGASAFTIFARYSGLNFYGAGITNNSGVVQTFGAVSELNSEINFYNSATAGENTIVYQSGTPIDDNTWILFHDTSSAGNATIVNEGNGALSGPGGTEFFDSSTAANATIFNRADDGGSTFFHGASKAGSATIVCEGGDDLVRLYFYDTSSAEEATIIINGAPLNSSAPEAWFEGTSTADNATLVINGGTNGGPGGTVSFFEGSSGGTARVELFGNGTLDIGHGAPAGIRIGSLEGDGVVSLGSDSASLTIGTNDLSTVFSGQIQGSGSIVKDGSGTLTLSSANSYTGVTSVAGGFLKVTNTSGSATGSGTVKILEGATFGGGGIVGGNLIAARHGSVAPGTGTTTLSVQKKVTFSGASYYVWRVKTISTQADKVIGRGVIISRGAFFTGLGIGSTALPPGTAFTAIENTSSAPISGTFRNFPDGGTIQLGNNTFQANYEDGDGNDLTLTVVP